MKIDSSFLFVAALFALSTSATTLRRKDQMGPYCHLFTIPFSYPEGTLKGYEEAAWNWMERATLTSIRDLEVPSNHFVKWVIIGDSRLPAAEAYKSHFLNEGRSLRLLLQRTIDGLIQQHKCSAISLSIIDADDILAPFFLHDLTQISERAFSQGKRVGMVGHCTTLADSHMVRGISGKIYGAADGIQCDPIERREVRPGDTFLSLGQTYYMAAPFPELLPRYRIDNHLAFIGTILRDWKLWGFTEKDYAVDFFPRKNTVYWMTPLSGRFVYEDALSGAPTRDQKVVMAEVENCLGFNISQKIIDAVPDPIPFKQVCSISGNKRITFVNRNWFLVKSRFGKLRNNLKVSEERCLKFVKGLCKRVNQTANPLLCS